MIEQFITTVSSTLDPPEGVSLYLRRDGDGYIVTDTIGLRHGWSTTILYALEEWAGHVEYLCSEPPEKLGGALLKERQAYRNVLGYDEHNTGTGSDDA